MTVLQVIWAVIILTVLPMLGGIGICRFMKTKPNPGKSLLAGTIFLWAICQLVLVPMVLLRVSFTAASNTLLLLQIVFSAIGLLLLLWGKWRPSGSEEEAGEAVPANPAPAPARPALSAEDAKVMEALEEMALREFVREGMQDMDGSLAKGNTAPLGKTTPFPVFGMQDSQPPAIRKDEKESPASGKSSRKISEKKRHSVSDYIFLTLMLLVIGVVIYQSIVLQRSDADDSRFVVNAVDMVRTDRMLLTNPATGGELSSFKVELAKDAVAPWAVYQASVAKWIGVSPTVVMHSVFPVLLVILVSLAYYLLVGKLSKGDLGGRCFFVFLCWLVNIYGYYSIYSSEAFAMTRSWQGKAVVASFAIPMMLYMFFRLFDHPKSIGRYICLLGANLSMCFLSSMGIIIGAVMLACYAVVYAVAKKQFLLFLKIMLLCVPNVVYYYLYTLAKAGKI